MTEDAKMLRKERSFFRMKRNVLLLSLQDKHLINMASTFHTAAAADDTSRQPEKTKENINVLLIANTYIHTYMVLIQKISIALMMGTEKVPVTLDFNELTRLSAREEFIKISNKTPTRHCQRVYMRKNI
jgi:hypothetical protein